jgi:hypothetical protein
MKEKFEEIATRYKITIEDVQKEYTNFAAKVKPIMERDFPDAVVEKTNEYFVQNVGKIFKPDAYTAALKREKDGTALGVIGTIVSISPPNDQNSYEKYKSRETYKADPSTGGMFAREEKREDGSVKLIAKYGNKNKVDNKGKEILDDSGNPIPNDKYGQDIPTRLMTKMLFFATKESCGEKGDGWKLLYASIPYNKDAKVQRVPGIMRKSKMIGTITRQPYFNVLYDAYADQGFITPDDVDLWSLASQFLPKEKAYIGLDQIEDLKEYAMWIARVNIVSIYDKQEGKVSIEMNSDDVVSGVKASSRNPKIVDYVKNYVDQNKEAYVIAVKTGFNDKETGERRVYNELIGIIPSTEVDSTEDEIMKMLSGGN